MNGFVRTTFRTVSALSPGLAARPDFRVPRLVFVSPFARALRYMTLFRDTLGLSDAALARFRSGTERQFGFRWEDFEVPEIADHVRTPPVLGHNRILRDSDVVRSVLDFLA